MSRRIRAWLGLWIVAMLCAVYIAGWVYYATMHQRNIAVQIPPGASVVTDDGVEIRILSMHQSRAVTGEFRTTEAVPGATFVIVTFEATVREPESFCHIDLAGRDGRTWDYTTKAAVGRPRSFSCHEFEPHVPTQGEIMFEIPQTEANDLLGVRVLYLRDSLFRNIAIRPPAGDPSKTQENP